MISTPDAVALGFAGFGKLIEQGALAEHEETVVILTGSGLKATAFYADLAEPWRAAAFLVDVCLESSYCGVSLGVHGLGTIHQR
jgi:threonine synthase